MSPAEVATAGFRIRDVAVAPGLVLAPMEGVTDVLFRRLVRSIGGTGLTTTEFIPGSGLAGRHRNALRAAEFDPDERPISIQVYGRDPAILADAARYVQDLGADVVDLNMGCPSKKVCAHSGGSGLLREPEVARAIVRAIRAAVAIPFTVKMRSGWDADHKNAPEIARMCEDEGVEGLAVHWRTRTDLYGGVRDLATVAAVKAAVRIPVLANGDVDETNAVSTLRETGCDGLMVGRGAIRDPWVFLRIGRALRGEAPLLVDDAERERVLLHYYGTLRERFPTERGTLGRMKKVARYFCDGTDDGEELRWRILHSDEVSEAIDRIRAFYVERRELGHARTTRPLRPPEPPAPTAGDGAEAVAVG